MIISINKKDLIKIFFQIKIILFFKIMICVIFCNMIGALENAHNLYLSDNLEQQDKGRAALRSITLDKSHHKSLTAAQFLYTSSNEGDKKVGKIKLLSCLEETNMKAVDAATFLFKNADNDEIKDLARKILVCVLEKSRKILSSSFCRCMDGSITY
ncbi:MAG: hypothetical protein FJX03_07710 [Alphaproteobacteria bacterium]|nr:hypothetical protein [Alphaproteobacteria bacterium]